MSTDSLLLWYPIGVELLVYVFVIQFIRRFVFPYIGVWRSSDIFQLSVSEFS